MLDNMQGQYYLQFFQEWNHTDEKWNNFQLKLERLASTCFLKYGPHADTLSPYTAYTVLLTDIPTENP